ncbi:MAG: COG4315 family predicted lipoprotein [Nocardioides sp.]
MIRWVAAALVLLLAGCAGAAPEPSPEASESSDAPGIDSPSEPTTTSAPSARPGTRISVRPSDYGPMLFDARDQAIYLFDAETTRKPRCYDACAEAWPPVLTDGDPVASGAAQSRMLGTTRRSDGAVQVTYGGHPLYFYAHESPGQVLCHDIEEFGGRWLVVTPAGDAAPH